jgi:hypothetical protein
MSWGTDGWGHTYWGGGEPPLGPGKPLPPVLRSFFMKAQYIASEPLRVIFPPFFDTFSQEYVISGDEATVVVKRPDNTLLDPPLELSRDGATDFWIAEIDPIFYQEGDWIFKATSDAENSLPQYKVLTWGDFLTDMRQAALGRWKIQGTQLLLYKDDGVTPFKTYNLRDVFGNPTATAIFDRIPVE